jgi:hypothetical protein
MHVSVDAGICLDASTLAHVLKDRPRLVIVIASICLRFGR